MDYNYIIHLFTICILLSYCEGGKLQDPQQFQDDSFLEISPMPSDDNHDDFYIDEPYETMKSFVPKEPVIESDEYAAPIPETTVKRTKPKMFKTYTSLNRAKKTIFPEGFSAPFTSEQSIKINQKEKIYVPPPRKNKKYLPPPGSRGNPDRSDGLLAPPLPEINRRLNENRNRRPQKDLLPPPPADMDFIPPIQDQDWKDLVPPMMDQQNYLPPYMQVPDEKYLPALNQEYLPIGIDFNRDPVQVKNRFNQPKEFSLNENMSRDQFTQNKQGKKYVPPENQYTNPEDQYAQQEKQFIPSDPDNNYEPPKKENKFNDDRFVISQPENGYIPQDNDDVFMPPNAEKELMDNQFGQRDFKKHAMVKNNYNPSEQEKGYNPPQQMEQLPQNQFIPSKNQYIPPNPEKNYNSFESEKRYIEPEQEKQFIPKEVEEQFIPQEPEKQFIPPVPENQYNPESQFIPPNQENRYIPPNQENRYIPPNFEKPYIPPNQENQYIPPNLEKQYIPSPQIEVKNESPNTSDTSNLSNAQNEFIPQIYENNPFLQRVNKRLKELNRLNQNIAAEENNQRSEPKYSNQYIPPENQYANEEKEKNNKNPNQFNLPEQNQYIPPEQNIQNSKFDQDETKNQFIQPNQYLSPTMRTYIENQYSQTNGDSVPQYSQNFVLDPTQPTNDTFLETPMATRRYDSSMYQFPEMMKPKTPSPLTFSHSFVTLQDGSSRSDLRQFTQSNSSQETPKEVFINGPQSKYYTTPEPYYGHNYKNFQSHQIGGKNNQIAMSRSEKGPINQDNKFELPSVEHLKPTQPSDFIQNHIQSMEQKLANKMSTIHSQELNQQLQSMESRPVATFTRSYGQPTPFSIIPQSTTEGIPILKQTSEMALDGSFSYETLTGDQTHMMQQGHIENPGTADEEQVIHGSYSYIGSDGITYTVHYVADGNGFRASGEHLPTPPPVPDIIQRAIEFNLNEEAERLARELQKQPHNGNSFQNNLASLEQIRERTSANKDLNNFFLPHAI